MAQVVRPARDQLPGDFFGGIKMRAAAWYDAIIDIMIAQPEASQAEIARQLGRHPGTIGAIVNSDIFRERFVVRKQQFIDAQNHQLVQKLQRVANQSLDATSEMLDKKRDQVPLKMLHEITTGTLDRLGYSPNSSGAPAVTIYNAPQANAGVQVASSGALQKAREHLAILQARPREASAYPGQLGQPEVLPRSEEAQALADEEEG